jgi:hypothetical protein
MDSSIESVDVTGRGATIARFPLMTDAVEKGFVSILVPLDVALNDLCRTVVAALRRTPPRRRLRDWHNQRRLASRWRPEHSERERLEVLHYGGEVELVACAGEAP